jgi:hypothetical protein
VYSGAGPAPSDAIDAFLVVQRVGETVRLRIARDARGLDLVPTLDEAKRAAEADKQRAVADKQQAEADKQQAEERATSAEERVRALEAELAKLRGGA